MRSRWTGTALQDLRDIRSFIAHDSPKAADRTAGRLRAAKNRLGRFPMLGRAAEPEGTRELAVAGMPYLLAYTVLPDTVVILRIMHGAQFRAGEEDA